MLAIAVCAVAVAVVDMLIPLPSQWFAEVESRRVLDRHGGVLAEQRVPHRGRELWVELDAIAPAVVDAAIASEDHRFWWHPGVDPLAMVRAAWADFRAGAAVQGGSTITQQTTRLLGRRPAGPWGKVTEAYWAIKLDLHLSKSEILTWYLNRVSFGSGAYGIEAAAREYFGEHAAGLSVSEAATLIGLLPAPERLNPRADLPAAVQVRDRVLARMVAVGSLTAAEADLARAEPLQLHAPPRPLGAPHLAASLLTHRTEARIQTTIDPGIQRQVEALVRHQLAALEGRGVDHAAVLVVDVATSEVRAWVGSGDWEAEDGQNDGVLARRSPGSTLKPFLYAQAFDAGWTPASVLPDIPARYPTTHGVWAPRNYSERFRGPVRAREALGCSLNVPAVALLSEVGVADFYQRLEVLGFELASRPDHYGLGLVLGDVDVTLAELTAAYGGLARGGVVRPLAVLAGQRREGTRFVSETAAWRVSDVLSDPLARVVSFGRYGPLTRSYPAAVKTGTSTGYRDNWTVGYTPEWVVGVWVGNFDGRPMGEVSGVTGAAPLWAAVMDAVTEGRVVPFERPEGLVRAHVCTLSGGIAGPECPQRMEEWVAPDPAPQACSWHVPGCRVAWPAAYAGWAAGEGRDAYDEGCPATGQARIAFPSDGAVLYVDPTLPAGDQRVPLEAAAPPGAREAVWVVDGQRIARVGPPFSARWTPTAAGEHHVVLEIDGARVAESRVTVGGVE